MIIYAGISVSLSDFHFSPKVLILLDVTPDQSLLSEGVAREVVNRIQKLRKKVTKHKVPSRARHATTQVPVCGGIKLVFFICVAVPSMSIFSQIVL